MPMEAIDIEKAIKAELPDADIAIRDLVGDKDHYEVKVASTAFQDKSRLEQHRLVKAALKDHLTTTLHALTLKTEAK